MPPKKKVLAVVKIQLDAGSATPAPPVGTALGPHGVQTMEFCKQYNQADREHARPGHARRDHDLRGPHVHASSSRPRRPRCCCARRPASTRARQTTGREQVGTITDAQLAEIATTKLKDLNTDDLEAAKKQVAGTARSMGIKVAG